MPSSKSSTHRKNPLGTSLLSGCRSFFEMDSSFVPMEHIGKHTSGASPSSRRNMGSPSTSSQALQSSMRGPSHTMHPSWHDSKDGTKAMMPFLPDFSVGAVANCPCGGFFRAFVISFVSMPTLDGISSKSASSEGARCPSMSCKCVATFRAISWCMRNCRNTSGELPSARCSGLRVIARLPSKSQST